MTTRRPVAYGHRDVLIRGYVDQVVISCGSEVIARHPRSYQRDDFVFNPIHYLPLLEQKTGALDRAAPLQGWEIIDELGFEPLSRTGAELLFEVVSQHYERGSILVTTNLPFDEWTEVSGRRG